MKKLLICICHHFNESRVQYLIKIIENFETYRFDIKFIIDCNSKKIFDHIKKDNVDINIYENLHHPHALSSMHRSYIPQLIDNFNYFMYIEDDILIPEANFIEHLNNFNDLYSIGCIPSFIRLENFKDKFYVTDLIVPQTNREIITVNNKRFVNTTNPYHAFWILPKKELKESLNLHPNAFNLVGCTNRELMASYAMWGLNKKPFVLIENDKFSKLSYCYHIANNYSSDPNSVFAKIEVDSFTIN